MPPKKKPVKKKIKQKQKQRQKQSQKQIINIKIGDDKKGKRRKRKVAKKQPVSTTPLASNLGNTLNMGIYGDLSRLNTLENLINKLIPNKLSTPINASVPQQVSAQQVGEKPISQSELDFITSLENIIEQPISQTIEEERVTPVKTTPPPRNIPQPQRQRASSISSLTSDDETIALPRRDTDYLSSGADTQRDLQTIDEMNLSASGFGDL